MHKKGQDPKDEMTAYRAGYRAAMTDIRYHLAMLHPNQTSQVRFFIDLLWEKTKAMQADRKNRAP